MGQAIVYALDTKYLPGSAIMVTSGDGKHKSIVLFTIDAIYEVEWV